MFDVEISGYDETLAMLERMKKGLTEEGINEYCSKIKAVANSKCGISDSEITLQAKKVDKEITIEFRMKDQAKLDCFKEAVRSVLPSMPITTKPLFEQLIIGIDKKYPKTN